jgi:hypothetical protein
MREKWNEFLKSSPHPQRPAHIWKKEGIGARRVMKWIFEGG